MYVFPMVPAGKALHEQFVHPSLREKEREKHEFIVRPFKYVPFVSWYLTLKSANAFSKAIHTDSVESGASRHAATGLINATASVMCMYKQLTHLC